MEKISIIVPIYNGEKYLHGCLKSLINQSYKNIEIILINDGSTDNTKVICEHYKQLDNRVKLINKNNEGVSRSRNIGIKEATGKYIGFVDCDDYISTDMYEKLKIAIDKSKADMSVCKYEQTMKIYESMLNKKNSKKYKFKIISAYNAIESIYTSNDFAGYTWNKLYKKEIIDNNKIKFDENILIAEDNLFNFEYLLKCKSVIVVNKVMYYYFQHNLSATNKKIDNKWLTILKVYKKIYEINKINNLQLNHCIDIGFINANFAIKKKIISTKENINNNVIDFKIIDTNIKKTFKKIMLNHKINLFLKIKTLLKILKYTDMRKENNK